jgi:hypothetical protein
VNQEHIVVYIQYISQCSSVFHTQEALIYFESLPSKTCVDIVLNACGDNLPSVENLPSVNSNEDINYSSRIFGLFNKMCTLHKCIICITDSLSCGSTKRIMGWCARLDCRYVPYDCKIGVCFFYDF